VIWIRGAAASFHPEANVVRLADGRKLLYDFLVACPGLKADGKVSTVEMRFEMIHVVPPQIGHDVVRASPLANAAGWIEVDPANLRHVRYPNIFALGDAASTTNAKTAAAVRIQAPIVVANLLAAMKGEPLPKAYDGYGACPRRSMWLLKTKLLPWLYWSHMFKGGEFDIPHRARGW
jgi:sulfide:quinone oxidoreductase